MGGWVKKVKGLSQQSAQLIDTDYSMAVTNKRGYRGQMVME